MGNPDNFRNARKVTLAKFTLFTTSIAGDRLRGRALNASFETSRANAGIS
jgi:hypothetical protein